MNTREEKIRMWFDMWLKKTDHGIMDLFSFDAVYIESWGPEYHGAKKIKHWFDAVSYTHLRAHETRRGISVELFLYGTLSNLFTQMSKRL